jgi:hypothetical protein
MYLLALWVAWIWCFGVQSRLFDFDRVFLSESMDLRWTSPNSFVWVSLHVVVVG